MPPLRLLRSRATGIVMSQNFRGLQTCHPLQALRADNTSNLLSVASPQLEQDLPNSKNIPLQRHATAFPSPARPPRIVIGITGATGGVYAIRILSILQQLRIETHLVISKWGLATLKYETPLSEADIRNMATRTYTAKDLSAGIASGSFQHDGMMIVPCSMKTLAAVRSGFCDDLISRAADVTLKENRKLLLAVRETPLSDLHLDNMLFLRRAGAVIFPPVPAFYTKPQGLEDVIDQTAGRMLDLMGIHTEGFARWDGFERD